MKSSKLGIMSLFTSSLCCVVPVLLAATGLGGLGLSAFIGSYHWYFIAGSAIVLAFSWRTFLKEGRCSSSDGCQTPSRRVARFTLPLATLAVVGFAGLNLYAGTRPPMQTAVEEQSGMERSVINVEGMTCTSCTIVVESALSQMAGVQNAGASVPDESVSVVYDPSQVTLRQLVEAINGTGYSARVHDPGS